VKLVLLINPSAGKQKGGKIAKQAIEKFQKQGIEIKAFYSEYQGHLIELAKKAAEKENQGIVAIGGDGTVFEVINGMIQSDKNLVNPLGVIPVGTGNSFSKDLSIQSTEEAIQNIILRKTRPVDLGKCQCRDQKFYFINVLGFGFVADIVKRALSYKKLGDLSYVISVFLTLKNLKSYQLDFEIDGVSYQRENVFVEICNSRMTGGNMLMSPQTEIDNGYLDVVLLNKISKFEIIKAFPRIYKGIHVNMPEVEVIRGKEMTFKPVDEKFLTPDGEIVGQTPITVSILPGKIQIFDS